MIDFTFFRSRTSVGANLVGFLDHVRDVRAVLLRHALHAERPALLAAPDRPAVPALDDRDHRHGPARRTPHRPGRPAAADDARARDRRRRRSSSSRGSTVHSGYGLLLPGFILMGLGMGLVMSPMSTAAMNAVDRTKAGAASGVLSMSRMVGSTFGVADHGRARRDDRSLEDRLRSPPRRRRTTRDDDRQLARQRRDAERPRVPAQVVSTSSATRSSRRSAPACSIGGAVTLAGAVVGVDADRAACRKRAGSGTATAAGTDSSSPRRVGARADGRFRPTQALR